MWAIFCYFPKRTSRELDQKQSDCDTTVAPVWDPMLKLLLNSSAPQRWPRKIVLTLLSCMFLFLTVSFYDAGLGNQTLAAASRAVSYTAEFSLPPVVAQLTCRIRMVQLYQCPVLSIY